MPAAGVKEVVDLVNFGAPNAPPLFKPDATAPIDIGGVELASPHDGALLNNLFDAVFLGDTAAWVKSPTLFGDWLGINQSGAAGGAAAAMLGVGVVHADHVDLDFSRNSVLMGVVNVKGALPQG